MAITRSTGNNTPYVEPSSLPSGNPPAPPWPDAFDPRPQEFQGPVTVDRYIAPHSAFDAMAAAPEVSGADGGEFRPLSAT